MVQRNYIGSATRESIAAIESSIIDSIKNANERLKSVKVSILKRANKLYLRATLPQLPKDGNTDKTKRYELSTSEATLQGVLLAEKKALELRQYLQVGNLDWWTLFPELSEQPEELKTMQIIKQEFEKTYWLNREKTRKTLATWDKSYLDIFKKINDDDLFTESNLIKWLETTKPNSKPRQDLIRVCKCLAVHANIEIDWKKYPCKYKPKKRILPTDTWIEACYDSMPKEVNWSFGLIATYGLRPSEMFQLTDDFLKRFVESSNKRYVLYIPDDTKTGEREVYPLYPQWVERFDLLNISQCESEGSCLEYKVSQLNKLFHKYGFKNPAYDLRHRYAIRASELGVLVDIAAKWMGHSVEEHCKTYQRWMPKSTHHKAFDKLIKANEELTELERLKLENQWLKDENSKLRTMLIQLGVESD